MSKTSKQDPKKKAAVAPAKGIAGPVRCQKVVTAVDDREAPTKPSREDRANHFIWGPDDVEHH